MINSGEILRKFENKEFDDVLIKLYPDNREAINYQRKRYTDMINKSISLFGDTNVEIYSAPGRTEVGGNHTDHQHGEVLAASINLDAIAIVSNNSHNKINIYSIGYAPIEIDLNNISYNKEEEGTTTSIIKGVLNGFTNHGFKIGGFNACITSDVLNGAGLSSSAAFETLIGTIFQGFLTTWLFLLWILPLSVSMLKISFLESLAD